MFWAARALHWRIQRAYNLGRKVWVISKIRRDGDRLLQLLVLNEEFLVSTSHQLVLITSLPFVHTARRSYRLNGPVNTSDCEMFSFYPFHGKLNKPYHLEEGEVVTRFP